MGSLWQHAHQWVLDFGPVVPAALRRKLFKASGMLDLGAWMKTQGLVTKTFVRGRQDLFKLVATAVAQKPVLYLEFGVANGASMRTWSKLLSHPDSILHGFDSFVGLPEPLIQADWVEKPAGAFSNAGVVPMIADPRVRLFKGMFDQTLPTYEAPERDVTIINMDADLYSSTLYVLRILTPLFRPGTYLFFDEFSCLGHEERAFREFVLETGFRFTLLAGTRGLGHIALKCESV